MSASINEIQDEIIEEFELFDDWMQKYDHLIEMGKSLPIMDASLKTDDRLIKGCQSKVWLVTSKKNGLIEYFADSDAVISKGVIAMLIRVLNNHTPEEIVNADLYFIDRIGLKEHLSPNRSNGLVSMIRQMKLDALALSN
ncbi:MAG: SufE family protein [Flavobacteriales bacterium]|nr:SufE family protein [Flavobacteriales bacterium]